MASITTLAGRVGPFLRREWLTLRDAPRRRLAVPSRPPPRARLERRLRGGGLECVVRGVSRRVTYPLALASPRKLMFWGAATVIWTLASLVTIWIWLGRERTFRFINFLPFDVLAGVTLVLSFLAWRLLRKREDARLARNVGLTGLGVTAFVAAIPHLLFSTAHLDTTVAGWLSTTDLSADAAQQSFFPHAGIAVAVAGLIAAEAAVAPIRRPLSLARSALASVPRTMVDVLRTLPTVLTVLFFVGFVEETWRIFGGMTAERVAVLIGVLFLCVFAVVMRLAKEEAEIAMGSETSEVAVNQAAQDDKDVGALTASGATLRAVDITNRDIRRAVIRQWRIHIFLRVALAGIVVALLMLVITSLTMSEELLNDWLSPTTWIDTDILGVHVYLAAEAISVAAVLGSFASVVFAGSTLAASDSRNEMLAPERRRLRDLLALGGTYESADDQRLWRGKRGATWDTYAEFLSDYPDRRGIPPDVFGSRWTTSGRGRWRVEYNDKTGEIYTWRTRPPGGVEVLAVCHDRERVFRRLNELQAEERSPDSVSLLRERTGDFADDATP